jgi:hypothetical protein
MSGSDVELAGCGCNIRAAAGSLQPGRSIKSGRDCNGQNRILIAELLTGATVPRIASISPVKCWFHVPATRRDARRSIVLNRLRDICEDFRYSVSHGETGAPDLRVPCWGAEFLGSSMR